MRGVGVLEEVEVLKEIKGIYALRPYYERYFRHIDAFLDNNVVNGMIVVGEAGIGKSFNLFLRLEEKGINYVVARGHCTPLSFYRMLYEHRDGWVIVIEDAYTAISDREIQTMLLDALDYNLKVVQWNSSSMLEDLPESFTFSSKIIIVLNEIPKDREIVRALKDRCIIYKMRFSLKEKLEMMRILAEARGYPAELVDYIEDLAVKEGISNLSLRLLDKVHSYFGKEGWKDLIEDLLEKDPVTAVVRKLLASGLPVKKQVEIFTEETGLSRRTFFRIKKRIAERENLILNDQEVGG